VPGAAPAAVTPEAPRAQSAREPLFTRHFLLLITAQFLQSLGYSSMVLLPLYLEFLGANRAEIGAVMGASAIGGLALRPVIAWSLDRVGRKKTLVVGTAVLAVSVGALGLVESLGGSLIAIRAVIGVGIAALFTGYFTFASDIIPATRRTEGLAIFGIFGIAGLLVNPVAEWLGFEGATMRQFFPVVGLLIGASLVPLAFVPERYVRADMSRGSARALGGALRALIARPTIPVWWATAVFSTLVAAYMAFATVSARESGFGAPGTIWLAYAAGAVSVRVFGARLPDRVGPSNLLAPAIASYVIAFLTAAGASSGAGFIISGALAGAGHGYCFPVLTSQVVTRTPRTLTGSGMAMFTGLWEVTALVFTPAFGLIADATDDATMFASVAVFATLGLAVWLLLEALLAPSESVGSGA
jgi:MFS family permease